MSPSSDDMDENRMLDPRQSRTSRPTRNQAPKYSFDDDDDADGVTEDEGDVDEYYEKVQGKGKSVKKATTRKKQAVTKTRDRAVIAKIEESRRSSPLLGLPTEVLQKILKYLLGGRLIHIEYIKPNDYDTTTLPIFDSDGQESDSGSWETDATNMSTEEPYLKAQSQGFCSTFCEAHQSEEEAYHEAMAGYNDIPHNELSEFYVANWVQRHQGCYQWKDRGESMTQRQRVDLRVMGTSRQLYEECNILLWSTNTFSFDDSISFVEFLKGLNPAQKRKFANISINIEVPLDGWHSFYHCPFDAHHYWHYALSPARLKMLRGLKTLRLSIVLRDGFGGWASSGFSQFNSREAISRSLSAIKRLEALPLKDVTVIVSDASATHETLKHSRWTRIEKLAFAEAMRAELVADHTAEIQRATAEAQEKRQKELAARPSETKRARAYIRWRSSLADNAQTKLQAHEEALQKLQKFADEMAAKADEDDSAKWHQAAKRATDKAREVSLEGHYLRYKATKLRDQADEVTSNPSLAKRQRIAWDYLSEDSDSE